MKRLTAYMSSGTAWCNEPPPPDLSLNVDEPRLVYITSVAMNLWMQEPRCLRSSIAIMKHHDQKANWGRKGLFGLCFHVVAHH